MKSVVRLELVIKSKKLEVVEYPIEKHPNQSYETDLMYKGYQLVNGEKIRRRVYKNELDKQSEYINLFNVLKLEDCLISYMYVLNTNIENNKIRMINDFMSIVENLNRYALNFVENFNHLCSLK